jgi:hypothetical protein
MSLSGQQFRQPRDIDRNPARLVAADGGKTLFGVSVQSTERHEDEQRKSKRER